MVGIRVYANTLQVTCKGKQEDREVQKRKGVRSFLVKSCYKERERDKRKVWQRISNVRALKRWLLLVCHEGRNTTGRQF